MFCVQAHGCIEVLVAAMACTDVVCAQFAVWAVQSLTGVLTSLVAHALLVTASALIHADFSGNCSTVSGGASPFQSDSSYTLSLLLAPSLYAGLQTRAACQGVPKDGLKI